MMECISVNKELQVNLTCKGYSIPLSESSHSCKLTRLSMLENFASHGRNKGTEFNGILEKLYNIQILSAKRSPKVVQSIDSFRFTTRYNFCQT